MDPLLGRSGFPPAPRNTVDGRSPALQRGALENGWRGHGRPLSGRSKPRPDEAPDGSSGSRRPGTNVASRVRGCVSVASSVPRRVSSLSPVQVP